MASIDIDAMGDLVRQLEAGAESLQSCASSIRSASQAVWGSAGETRVLDEAAGWARDQAPGLHRRLALARHIEAQQPGLQSVVSIDEARLSNLSPEAARSRGAALMQELLDSEGEPSAELVAELQANQLDPYFAAGLASAASPEDLAEVVYAYGGRRMEEGRTPEDLEEFDAGYTDLLSGLSTTIGTATHNTGSLALPDGYAKQWVDVLTRGHGDEGFRFNQAASLAGLLRYGSYSTEFLGTVAEDVYAHERSEDGEPVWAPKADNWAPYLPGSVNSTDVLASVMAGLGNNPTAAQRFLDSGGTTEAEIDGEDLQVNERLHYLIEERDWSHMNGSDEGDGLGRALEAATTYHREAGPEGETSARLASQTLALVGDLEKNGDGWHIYEDMRDSVAEILGSYAPDLVRVANPEMNSLNAGLGGSWLGPGTPGFPPPDAGGLASAQMDEDLIVSILRTLGTEDDHIRTVMAGAVSAQQISSTWALSQGIDPSAPGGNPANPSLMISGTDVPVLENPSASSAATFGFIVNNAYEGDLADEEAAKKRAEMLSQVFSVVTAIPPLAPAGAWANFAVSSGRTLLAEQIKSAPEGSAGAIYGEMDEQTKINIRHNMMNLMLANGWLDDADFAAANEAVGGGNTYVPPPREALMRGDNGNPTDPPQFDFDSEAYDRWEATVGVSRSLTDSAVAAYNDAFPNVR